MNSTRKNTLIILASIVIVAVIAVGTVFIFKAFQKPTEETNQTQLTAQDTVSLAATTLQADPQTKDFEFLPNGKGQRQSIIVADAKTNTALIVSSESYVAFQKLGAVTTENVTKTKDTVKKFFTDNKFVESKSINAGSTIALRYASGGTQCQFSHFVDNLNTNNGFQLVCTNVSDHSNDLLLIDQLLDLWKKPVTYDYLMQDSITEGNYTIKSINTVNTSDPAKSHTLLYAKDNGAWVYIADATEGDPKLSNGKYILNDDLKKGLANAQYGPLLTKYLGSAKK